MNWRRIFKHVFASDALAKRSFPKRTLDAIQQAVSTSESAHRGEMCFAVEASYPAHAVWRNVSPRARALDVFSRLRLWDTDENTGLLIYVCLADRDVEIIADRGIAKLVQQSEWEAICRAMESEFRQGKFEAGALKGVAMAGELLARHFPATGERVNPNEFPDRPVML